MKTTDKKTPFITPEQLAVRWQWHSASIRRFLKVNKDTLPQLRLGNRIRIPREAIEKYEQQNTTGTKAQEPSSPPKLERAKPKPAAVSKPRSYLTTEDLTARYGYHVQSIRRMVRDGRLPAIRVGRSYFFPPETLSQFEASTAN